MNKLRKFAFFLLLGISFMGCSEDDDRIEENNSLVGTWQLVQIYEDSGAGSGKWNEVEDGYTYRFSQNAAFSSTRFSECTSGTFSLESNLLILDYGCEGFSAGMESPDGVFVEEFTFKDGLLVMYPTYLTCDEGCGYKFRRTGN